MRDEPLYTINHRCCSRYRVWACFVLINRDNRFSIWLAAECGGYNATQTPVMGVGWLGQVLVTGGYIDKDGKRTTSGQRFASGCYALALGLLAWVAGEAAFRGHGMQHYLLAGTPEPYLRWFVVVALGLVASCYGFVALWQVEMDIRGLMAGFMASGDPNPSSNIELTRLFYRVVAIGHSAGLALAAISYAFFIFEHDVDTKIIYAGLCVYFGCLFLEKARLMYNNHINRVTPDPTVTKDSEAALELTKAKALVAHYSSHGVGSKIHPAPLGSVKIGGNGGSLLQRASATIA